MATEALWKDIDGTEPPNVPDKLRGDGSTRLTNRPKTMKQHPRDCICANCEKARGKKHSQKNERSAVPSLASAGWLDALAQELARRAALADKNAACPDSAKLLREVASSCLVVIEAAHRADAESAKWRAVKAIQTRH